MALPKLLGLAATAVAVLTVSLVVAGPAQATTLCQANEDPCEAVKSYAVGQEYEAELETGTKLIFKGEGKKFPEVVCSESRLQFKTTNNTGEKKVLLGEVTSLLAEKCTNCTTVTATVLPWTMEVFPEEPPNGNGFGGWSMGKGKPTYKFEKCPLGVICTYEAKSLLYVFNGGKTQNLVAVEVLFEFGSGNKECGTKMRINLTYKITKPTPVWVSAKP
jgi:hypothetical protein